VIFMDYKRKKKVKQRGTKTHGWGAMKKHRGAGSRGGRGMAGTGKRGDANKPRIWKDKKYFGKHGFTSKGYGVPSINVSDIEKDIDEFIKKGLAKDEKGVFVVNLADLGYEKLLGKNKVTKKFKITALKATKKAIEKVKNSNGEVIILSEKVEKEQTEG